MINNKKAQDEMVGFALIIIIVSVILLVVIAFSINTGKREAVQSFEADSFVQGVLQYTSNCSEGGLLSIRELTFGCNNGDLCDNNERTCDILNSTLKSLVNASWGIGKDSPYKGYELIINTKQKEIINITKGNFTNNYKGAFESFAKSGDSYEITFNIFY